MISFRVLQVAGLLLLASLSGGNPLRAQEDPGKPSVPNGPLLGPEPNPGQWTVTYSYPEERRPSGGGAPAAFPAEMNGRVRMVTITKVNEITHVQATRIHDDPQESWQVGTMIYGKPNGSDIYLESPQYNDDPSPLADSGNFPDLDWIKPASYVGLTKYLGRSCLVFAPDTAAALEWPGEALSKLLQSGSQIALVDAETRYPVEVHQNGVYLFYQFSNPPATLTLPDDLTAQLEKSKAKNDLDHQHAPRPY